MKHSEVQVGLVIPFRNEAANLPTLLNNLQNQEKIHSLCCIAMVDGNSSDNSWGIVSQWKEKLPNIKLISNPKQITPIGFNLGIKECLKAGAEAILISGAHGWLNSGYLVDMYNLLNQIDADIIGSVHRYPEAKSQFDLAIRAFSESKFGRGLSSISAIKEITNTKIAFNPIIRKHVFEVIGFFDETLERNQDNDFTTRAINAKFSIMTAPNLIYTYIPRNTITGFLKQMYGNGYGVGTRILSHSIKHFIPFIFYSFLLLLLALGYIIQKPLIFLLLALPYLFMAVMETINWMINYRKLLLWLPLLFISSHFVYAFGTITGIVHSVILKLRT